MDSWRFAVASFGGIRTRTSWASNLAALRRLTWRQRARIFEAALLLTAVCVALRAVAVRRLCATLGRLTSAAAGRRAPGVRSEALEIARSVTLASRHVPAATTCLHRAVTLWALLRRRGLAADLRFGARRRGDEIEAHAWVEHDGVVISDEPPSDGRYVLLPWAALRGER